MAAVLLYASCGQAKKVAVTQAADVSKENVQLALQEKAGRSAVDSLMFTFRNLQENMTELKETFAETVPLAQAQVAIPLQNLVDLPEGAKYGISDGRATVEVQRLGDNYIATGRCDSVARQCSRYERRVHRQQQTIDSLSAKVCELNSKLSQMAFESYLYNAGPPMPQLIPQPLEYVRDAGLAPGRASVSSSALPHK